MPNNKTPRALSNALRADVKKEMARPRMARSARIAEQELDPSRTPEKPSTTLPGIVDKITAPSRPNQPEKVQISVAKGPTGCRELCIENKLTDENGEVRKLKKGDRVEVTIEVKMLNR